MKKMILILILIVPVLIALVISLIAGSASREIANIQIERAWIPLARDNKNVNEEKMYKEFDHIGSWISFKGDTQQWVVDVMHVGDRIDMTKFMVLETARGVETNRLRYKSLVCTYEINGQPTKKDDSPVIIDGQGYLVARKATKVSVDIEVMMNLTVRRLMFAIELVEARK